MLLLLGQGSGIVIGQLLTGYFCDLDFLGGWPIAFYTFGKSISKLNKVKNSYIILFLLDQILSTISIQSDSSALLKS